MNSVASSQAMCGGNAPEWFMPATIMSLISLEIASIPSGINALNTRSTTPLATAAGAASHTNRNTGGTFRNAATRSFQEVSLVAVGEDIRYHASLATR